jgi:kumamolisin
MLSLFVILLLALSSVQGGRHIPEQIKYATDLGKVESNRKLDFMVVLDLNNEADLNSKLEQIYNPESPQYHDFITPEKYTSKYGPTVNQVNQVKSYLLSKGIEVTSVTENRFLINARGNVSTLNSMLKTDIRSYHYKGNFHFAPSIEFQFPEGLPIRAVHGLQDFTTLKSNVHRSLISPDLISGYFTPSDITKAYNVPSSLTGSGQTLALFELDGYTASDISSYTSKFKLRAVPLQNIYVAGFNGVPGSNAGEVTLDIELMNALAPGATKILVYEAPNTEVGLFSAYQKIATDNLARQVSSSWGLAEDEFPAVVPLTEQAIFKQMALQGQSFYAASGDNGADGDGSSISVDDPASQPYVVGVGGTKLTVNSATSAYVKETTWNELSKNAGAGGGGISTIWPQPYWQKGLSTTSNKGSSKMRNVPDVSLNSDPYTGYVIVFKGALNVFGGTSCAAPLWAAFNALVNQQRSLNKLGPIGFPNPALYQIGKASSYHTGLHDIADGSNNGHYPAVAGYDLATGWGSFNATPLIQLLQAPNPGLGGAYIINNGTTSFTIAPGKGIKISTLLIQLAATSGVYITNNGTGSFSIPPEQSIKIA